MKKADIIVWAQSPNMGHRWAAVRQPNCPIDMLAKLGKDSDPQLAEAAVMHINFPISEMRVEAEAIIDKWTLREVLNERNITSPHEYYNSKTTRFSYNRVKKDTLSPEFISLWMGSFIEYKGKLKSKRRMDPERFAMYDSTLGYAYLLSLPACPSSYLDHFLSVSDPWTHGSIASNPNINKTQLELLSKSKDSFIVHRLIRNTKIDIAEYMVAKLLERNDNQVFLRQAYHFIKTPALKESILDSLVINDKNMHNRIFLAKNSTNTETG
jgi:hypothetical protein